MPGAVLAPAGGGALYAELRPVFPLTEQADAAGPALPGYATGPHYDTARLRPQAGTRRARPAGRS
ncbi:hypothetical protein [Streptomyces sp. NBC_01483]|uniref:hypothetical protein n=1 Tax=Streptomyces sp. NBC_01483 TaxID=2903883 RepID=UPI002E34F701|nr:hypothetical protein [Streptomyces sp. NBC_01483]